MDLSTYQERAKETDNTAANYENQIARDVVVALLGIAGELGTLATTYKKYLRDGASYSLHEDHIAEELGDLLWYCAILASKFGLSLDDIARQNLEKVSGRWGPHEAQQHAALDEGYEERFPRQFSIEFSEKDVGGRLKAVMTMDGKPLGDPLTDNADDADDYRFHDAFHLAFLVVLGWSPVLRKLMELKRRSVKSVDENEDGGRAIVIEEGIAALVFDYGVDHGSLATVPAIDYELIRTLKSMTRRLEVRIATGASWQAAVALGWQLFRDLTKYRGGTAHCDLDAGTIRFEPPGELK